MMRTNATVAEKYQDMNGIEQPDLVQLNERYHELHRQRFNMAGYAAPRLSTVRVGIIGLGLPRAGPSGGIMPPGRSRNQGLVRSV